MRLCTIVPFVFAVIFSLLVAPLDAETLTFTAALDGEQANACAGTGSPATGTATFSLDTRTGEVTYEITFTEADLLGPETVAHVHGTAERCANAGVVFPLPLGNPKVGSATLTPERQAQMIDGLFYVNIHTTVNPGGEIRGQIVQSAGPEGARQIAGDCNQDGRRDVGDVICAVKSLFPGFVLTDRTPPSLPCSGDEGNLAVLDVNGDAVFNLADVTGLASFLFSGGAPPALGLECFSAAAGCAANPGCQ